MPQLCPCGKDVTDRKYAYHKYRCPKQSKETQPVQGESRVVSQRGRSEHREAKSTTDLPTYPTRPPSTADSGASSATANSRPSQDTCRPRAFSQRGNKPKSSREYIVTNVMEPKTKVAAQSQSMTTAESKHSSLHTKITDSEHLDIPKLIPTKFQIKALAGNAGVPGNSTQCPVRDSARPKTRAAPRNQSGTSVTSCSSPQTYEPSPSPVPREQPSSKPSTRRKPKLNWDGIHEDILASPWCPAAPAATSETKVSGVAAGTPSETKIYCGKNIIPEKAKQRSTKRESKRASSSESKSADPDTVGVSDIRESTPPGQSASKERSSTSVSFARDILDTRDLDRFVDQMVRENVIHYSKHPEEDIKKFFDDEVRMSQMDIRCAQKPFKLLREKIKGRLNVETNLGGWECSCGGSYADGTKVANPDEMDCILFPCLDTKLETIIDDTCQPGFCKVKVVGNPVEDDLEHFTDGDFLNSRKFRRYLFEKLEYIVHKDRRLEGMKSIDMDFVPSLRITPWPRGNVARDIGRLKIDESMAHKIKSYGFNAAPKQCTAGPKESRDLQWQISFCYAEKNITKHADKKCWKPVTRTIKRIVEIALGNSESGAKSKSQQLQQIQKAADHVRRNFRLDFHPRFTTYHIRTLMWTLLYDLTGEHLWVEDTKSTRLRFTLIKLRKMMTGEMVVPHFFFPGIKDIMRGVRPEERKFLYIIARATEIIFSEKASIPR